MAKINLPSITSGFASTTSFNTALDQLEAELQNKVLYRNNPTGEPNQMENDIDMNNNDLLNVATINGVSTTTINNLPAAIASAQASATAAQLAETNAELAEVNAVLAETNAETAATNAATSAATAAVYSSMGLGGASAFDFGSVTDVLIIFPTDWGLIV